MSLKGIRKTDGTAEYIYTDDTLSEENAPGEAKAAGDRIAGVEGRVTTLETAAPEIISNATKDWLDDNVTPTGSAVAIDSSLTQSGLAADAKAAGDAVNDLKSDLNEKIVDLGSGILDFEKSLTWQAGYINTSGVIVSSTASQFALFTMYAGEKLTIGTRNSNITIIGSTTEESLSVGDTVTVIKTTTASNTYQTFTYTAMATINIVVCVRASEYNIDFEKAAPFMALIDSKQDELTFDEYPTDGSNNPVKSNGIYDVVDSGVLVLSKAINWVDGYITTTGVINSSTRSGFCVVPLLKGETVTIGTKNSSICIIGSTTSDSVAVGDTVTVIQITRNTSAFQTYSYTATNDIKIVLCVLKSNYTLKFTRQTEAIKKLTNDYKNSVNYGFYNVQVVENGSFTSAGGPSFDVANRIRTDLISFKNGDKIIIRNGTLRHVCGMWNGAPSSETKTRNDANFVTADETITPDYDGYIVIVFADANNDPLSPEDFDGTIEHYNTLAYHLANDESDGSISLPEYYTANDYIADKIARINELGKAGDDVFVFITDIHWEKNARHSPALISYLNENCAIHKVFNGGDVADASVLPVYKKYRKAVSGKTYHIAGNHDWFSPSDGRDLYYCMDSANNDQIGEPFAHYYYVDNIQLKIRYIILNSFSRDDGETTLNVGYDADQIAWFSDVALGTTENDWDVIVFTHYLRTIPVVDGGTDIEAAIASFNGAITRTGKVLAVIQGHTHWDGIYHTASGVPVITTTCDKWDLSNESYIIPTEGIAFRQNNTITDQAFDVMILNRTDKTITAVRIGAPAQNNIDIYRTDPNFTWIGTLQERVVSYDNE